MNRIVEPELLDRLPPNDPRAMGSRRDLRRINRLMGNHCIVASVLRRYHGQQMKHIAELGAGDGHFLLGVAKKIAPQLPGVTATLLDLQQNVSTDTLDAFGHLGWQAKAIVADVFDWPAVPAEIVVANLFLHHFENNRLKTLFAEIARRSELFIAVEPRRASWPLFWSRMLWGIGCNSVTRHDAVVSVRAGFCDRELSGLWPDKNGWTLLEQRAGLFSHLFVARKN